MCGGPLCAERWAPRTAVGFSEHALPRRGRPTAPQVPSLLWQMGVRPVDGGSLPSPKNKQSQAQSALAQGREEGCVCRGRKQGGSVILLENKLHPLSIFIEDPERSSTRPGVCGLNGDVSLFLFLLFVLYFLFKKVLFYCLFYFFGNKN